MDIFPKQFPDNYAILIMEDVYMQEIEQGIPIPPKNRGGRKRKYRFGDLQVGESFYVECLYGEPAGRVSNRLSACATYYRPWEFRRAVEGAGVRVWRIA